MEIDVSWSMRWRSAVPSIAGFLLQASCGDSSGAGDGPGPTGASGQAGGAAGGSSEAGGAGAETASSGGAAASVGGANGATGGGANDGGTSGVAGSPGSAGMAGNGPAARVEYVGAVPSLADLASYLFEDVPIGSAAPDRMLIVATHAASDPSVAYDRLRINGADATKIIGVSEAGPAPTAPTALFAMPLAAGDTADIEVDLSTAVVRCAIGVFAGYGLRSLADDAAELVSIEPASMQLDVPQGGFVIAALSMAGDDLSGAEWSGLDESYDFVMLEGTPTLASAAMLAVPSGGPLTIEIATMGNGRNFRAVAASFR